MTSEIHICHAGNIYTTRSFIFPGGEVQVQMSGLPERLTGDATVLARLQSADAIVRLLLATEILQRSHRGAKRLVISYFPFAGQDRVMQPGEAFSLKAAAKLVNGLSYDEVTVYDPHSDVTAALLENVRVVPQLDLIQAHAPLCSFLRDRPPIIVAPDAGATKKGFAVAHHFGLPLVTASKVRDTTTGAITRTELHAPAPLDNADVLIVDDICDGGRTFVELAKVLRQHGAGRVFLYVTHGIFSQGLGVFQGLIDGVFTTDSFLSRDVETPHQSPIPLHVHHIDFGQLCP